MFVKMILLMVNLVGSCSVEDGFMCEKKLCIGQKYSVETIVDVQENSYLLHGMSKKSNKVLENVLIGYENGNCILEVWNFTANKNAGF